MSKQTIFRNLKTVLYMADKRLKVVFFLTNGGSGWSYLRKHDTLFNKTYKVVAGFTDNKNASGIEHFPGLYVLDYKDWCKENKYSVFEERRDAYFQAVYDKFFKGMEIDLLALSGFMKKIQKSFLDKFPNRIINIHPADLRKLNPDGKRRYTGDNAVELAMNDGLKKTFSTIHFAEEEIDHGKIICISRPLPIKISLAEKEELIAKVLVNKELNTYAQEIEIERIKAQDFRTPQEQQNLMKIKCDGPALQNAMRLITLPENSEFRVKIGI